MCYFALESFGNFFIGKWTFMFIMNYNLLDKGTI